MGHGVMMINIAIVVVLFAILFIATIVTAFPELPRDMCDVLCFLAMIAVCVAIVLAFIVRGA